MSSFSRVDETGLKKAFDRDGYVILKAFLASTVIEGVREELDVLVDRQAQRLLALERIADPLKHAPFETRIARLFEHCMDLAPTSFRPELHGPRLFDLFFHPRLLDVVQWLLGPEIRLYPNYTARPKFPEWKGTLVLWHQDGGYTAQAADGVETLRMVNVWAPLVPATKENGCMQFVPGTHRLGIVPHEKREYYLEISQAELDPRLGQAVSIEVDPGDVVLFHNLMFHCGLPNRTRKVRWSMDWRYQDATQPTMRTHRGHLARSGKAPEDVVRDREDWAEREFQ
ncbi:MAG: phytanoyl-CoA dioxygenase family protein [Gemmatimonadota bacterium]|nr:phytanoyl-CoA dioxygenase family protein [Gemmatimonadota bacterium]